jgi:hypothetical protein
VGPGVYSSNLHELVPIVHDGTKERCNCVHKEVFTNQLRWGRVIAALALAIIAGISLKLWLR